MRTLLVVLFVFLLTACSSRTAEDAYKEGKYLESIDLIAEYVEDKGEAKLDAEDLERFRKIVSNVMAHYENQLLIAERTDYASRITSYEALLTMKNRLSNRFYSQQVYFFNNKYDIKQLRQLIAEEYYLYGNSINATDAKSYYLKASLYRNGMEQYKYKDIEKLYNQANTKYMQVAAQEYYEQGVKFAAADLYKDAAEYFAKAAEVYKPLGKYKDSEQLFVVYDKKYRLNEAQNFYQQAEDIKSIADTRFEYRQMAALYNDAATIYLPYGDYKNSAKLAKEYQQKGILKIYIPVNHYNALIEKKISADYIQFVNKASLADLTIDITAKSRYNEYPQSPTMKAISENILDKTVTLKNPDGTTDTKDIYKTYYYNLQSTTLINVLELNTDINVSGLYKYNQTNFVKKSSNMTKYVYSGDVPNKYSNYTAGNYLSKSKLMKDAEIEQEKFISTQLSYLATIFKRL